MSKDVKKGSTSKGRDFSQLAIARREALGRPGSIPSKKIYKRKPKHRQALLSS